MVSVIKSVGGVGATALLSQLAIRFAENEASCGREACLIDLDVQFGDVAFQLGLRPKLTLADLLEAGNAARRRSASGDHDRASQRAQGHCRAARDDAARRLCPTSI